MTEYSSDVKLGVEGGSGSARRRGDWEITAHNTQTFVFPLEAGNSARPGSEDDSREVVVGGQQHFQTFQKRNEANSSVPSHEVVSDYSDSLVICFVYFEISAVDVYRL